MTGVSSAQWAFGKLFSPSLRGVNRWSGRLALCVIVATVANTPTWASDFLPDAEAMGGTASGPPDPEVPIGVHPDGAVTIGIVGGGIDYTDPRLVPHLARDGEGFLLGFDFIDGDLTPFGDGTTELAALLVEPSAEHGLLSLHAAGVTPRPMAVAPLRINPDDLASVPLIAGFLAQMPVDIFVIPVALSEAWGMETVFAFAEALPQAQVAVAMTQLPSDAALQPPGNVWFAPSAQAAELSTYSDADPRDIQLIKMLRELDPAAGRPR